MPHRAADRLAPRVIVRWNPLPLPLRHANTRACGVRNRRLGRSTLGVVETTRACGRGCQFRSIAARKGHSLPLDRILQNVEENVLSGANDILLTTEDMFLYEQRPKFATNTESLLRLFERVASVRGVEYLSLSHATVAPIVAEPSVIHWIRDGAVGYFGSS